MIAGGAIIAVVIYLLFVGLTGSESSKDAVVKWFNTDACKAFIRRFESGPRLQSQRW